MKGDRGERGDVGFSGVPVRSVTNHLILFSYYNRDPMGHQGQLVLQEMLGHLGQMELKEHKDLKETRVV